MNQADHEYKGVVQTILHSGEVTETRNSKVIRSFYPFVMRFTEAPLLGARMINHHLGIREMESFINGVTSVRSLHPSVKHWWKPFSDENDQLGDHFYSQYYEALPVLIEDIKINPFSRRHVISCWDYWSMDTRVDEGFLPNCHSTVLQFYVDISNRLHYKTYQRSADVMLGLPYNLIQHWALLEWMAHRTGYEVGTMSYILGDSHIYKEHWSCARTLVETRAFKNDLRLVYTPSRDKFLAKDFKLEGECDFPIKTKLKMEV